MLQRDNTHTCPNCGRPLLGPALSSVGVGDTILLRGCGECLPAAIFAAVRRDQHAPIAPRQEATQGAAMPPGAGGTGEEGRP